MNVKFIKTKEKNKIIKELERIYGVKKINGLLIETGKQRIRIFTGSLTKEKLGEIDRITNIELIGSYAINKKDELPRINFDMISLKKIKNQITESIFEINDQQLNEWFHGLDLNSKEKNFPRGILVLKNKEDLIGIGKSNGETIFNYLPKERKLKTNLSKSHQISNR